VEEGAPISYQVLDTGVPVYSLEGEQLGTVDHVVAAMGQDIFHGLVMRSREGRRFIAADQVASLHERGVDLRIDAAAAAELPEPHGAAPVRHVHEPGLRPSRWHQIVDMLTGQPTHDQRDWTDEE
jgi:hypothetical protein